MDYFLTSLQLACAQSAQSNQQRALFPQNWVGKLTMYEHMNVQRQEDRQLQPVRPIKAAKQILQVASNPDMGLRGPESASGSLGRPDPVIHEHDFALIPA